MLQEQTVTDTIVWPIQHTFQFAFCLLSSASEVVKEIHTHTHTQPPFFFFFFNSPAVYSASMWTGFYQTNGAFKTGKAGRNLVAVNKEQLRWWNCLSGQSWPWWRFWSSFLTGDTHRNLLVQHLWEFAGCPLGWARLATVCPSVQPASLVLKHLQRFCL